MVMALQLSRVVSDSFLISILSVNIGNHLGKLAEHLPDLILLSSEFPLQALVFSISPIQLVPEWLLHAVMVPFNLSKLLVLSQFDLSQALFQEFEAHLMLVSVILGMSLSCLLVRDACLMFFEWSIIPYSHRLYLVVDSLVEGSLGHRSLHGLAHVRDGVLYLCDQLLS